MKLAPVPSPPPSLSVFLLLLICFLFSFLISPPSIDFDVRPISSSPSPNSRSTSHSALNTGRSAKSSSKSSKEKGSASPAAVADLPIRNDFVAVHDIPRVCPPGAVHHDGHVCEVVKFNQVDEAERQRNVRTANDQKENPGGPRTSGKSRRKKEKKEMKQNILSENELNLNDVHSNSLNMASNLSSATTETLQTSEASTVEEKPLTKAALMLASVPVSHSTKIISPKPTLSASHPHHSGPGQPKDGHKRRMIKYSVIPLHEATSYSRLTPSSSATAHSAQSSNHVPELSASVHFSSTTHENPSPSEKPHEQLLQLQCPPGYTRREDGHPDECALTPSRILNRKHTRPFLTLPGCPLGYRPTNATSCACDVDEAGRDDSACLWPAHQHQHQGEGIGESVMMVMIMPRTECPSGFSYRHADRVCVRCQHYFELAHNGQACLQKVVVDAV